MAASSSWARDPIGLDLLLVGLHPCHEPIDVAAERGDVALGFRDERDELREPGVLPSGLGGQLLDLAGNPTLARLVRLDRALQLRHALPQETYLVVPGVLLHVELVEALVRLHELGLHGVHLIHLLRDRLVRGLDLRGDDRSGSLLLFQPALSPLLVLQQALEAQELDLQLHLEDLVPQDSIGFRLLRLGFEGVVAAAHLVDDPLDVAHVLLGLLQLVVRLLTAHPKPRDSRGLLEDVPPLLRPGGEKLIDLALLHDGVCRLADPGVEEQLPDIPQLDGVVVDEVFPFADRNNLRRMLTSGRLSGRTSGSLETRRLTSATFSGLRVSVPAKMTSCMFSARRDFADCSPRTHFMASTTLLLPQPFGPRRAATPSAKSIWILSAKDLKPKISRLFRNTSTPSRIALRLPA